MTAGPPQNPEDPRRGPFSEEERSDLFSVEPYSKGASIPPLERVPLTPEELRRQRNRRVALIAATVLAVVALVVVSGLLVARARLEAALERAGDTGRVAAVDEALGLVEGSGDPTYRALAFRLRAMRLLAGEEEDVEALAAMGEDLPTTGRAGRQRGIGATYLALAQGDLEAAMRSASAVVARGPDAVEAARARALAARAVGNAEQARQAALLAVNQRPEAPRHVALLAELLAQTVGAEAGLDRLDQLPRDVTSAAVTLARARILEAAGADRAEVEAAARAVLAFDDATDHERSWAELLLAHVAADQGHRATARAHLARAEEEAPPGDERFTLGLIEAALRNGAASQAERVARRLPSPLSVDAGRRALVDAELALAAHAGRRAAAALEHAPEGPRAALARARLAVLRDRGEEARPLFREASTDPKLRVPALTHLASLELESGQVAEAVSLVEPLLRDFPGHPDVVPIAVEARLGQGDVEAAEALVAPVVTAHPRDIRLLAAEAHVEMARQAWAPALAILDRALAIEPEAPTLHADRGRVALGLGDAAEARSAFDRALALSPALPEALVGRLELDIAEHRLADGQAILDRIDESELTSLRVERLRGALLLRRIAGQTGVRAVRTALRAHAGDPELTLYLAHLYMQAEQGASAVRTLARLANRQDAPVPILVARVLAQVRRRANRPARTQMDELLEDLDRGTLAPEVQAQLLAVEARLDLAEDNRVLAQRRAEAALEIDPSNAEAHLVQAELRIARDFDATAALRASLNGAFPHSRPLALLALREEVVTPEVCEWTRRYRRAAPSGQYQRGTWRVMRDCRALED